VGFSAMVINFLFWNAKKFLENINTFWNLEENSVRKFFSFQLEELRKVEWDVKIMVDELRNIS
jgi:hypothetical protein